MPTALGFPRMFIFLAGFGIVLWLLSWLQPVLVPVVLAALLAFLLSPVVTFLQRRHFPRILAVAAAVIAAFSLIGGIGWTVARQVTSLVDSFPQYEKNLSSKVDALKQNEPAFIKKSQWVMQRVARQFQKIRPLPAEERDARSAKPLPVKVVEGQGLFPLLRLWSASVPVLKPFAMLGLSVVLLLFMLLRREDLRDRVIDLIGQGRLTVTTKAIDDAAARISQYLLRQLAINASFGLAVSVGLYILGVPYALLWGFFAGVLRYIPYLGAWVAALLPLGLSLIVSDSWTQPLLVLAMFLMLEFLVNMILEPWLYGKCIGVSEMAVVLMIVFWTWLWGPVGLVVATPLTVCLTVLGKYVPSLGFLETLLGNQRVLEAHVGYYQRLLARDHDEASEIAARYLDETSLSLTYERLLIPALTYAKQDRERGTADEDDYRFIITATREVVEELDSLHARKPGDEPAAPDSRVEAMRLLLIPACDEADEISADMLRNLLDPERYRVSAARAGILASDVISLVDETQPALACILALPPGGGAHARLLCMRLRGRYPELKILIARWNLAGDAAVARARFIGAGADQFAATLEETCNQFASWRSLVPSEPAPVARSQAGLQAGLR